MKNGLSGQLKTYGISDVKDVFLATCDLNQKFTVYTYTKGEIPPGCPRLKGHPVSSCFSKFYSTHPFSNQCLISSALPDNVP